MYLHLNHSDSQDLNLDDRMMLTNGLPTLVFGLVQLFFSSQMNKKKI